MQKFCSVFKCVLVMLLTFAILLPVLMPSFAFDVSALDDEEYITTDRSNGTCFDSVEKKLLESGEISLEESYGTYANQSASYSVIEDLIINNFFQGNDSGTKKAVAILTSGALKTTWSGVKITVRVPDLDELVTLDGDTLIMEKYSSNYNGHYWEPYSYTVNGKTYILNGLTKVNIADAKYDTVEVEYRLMLTNITGLQAILDLPQTLVDEAASQIAALDKLNNYYTKMGEIGERRVAFALLAILISEKGDANGDGIIEDSDLNELYNALSGFYQECFEGNSLKIYNLLTSYQAEGLISYYRNSNRYHKEIPLLHKYLTTIGKHQTVLKEIVASSELGTSQELEKALVAIDKIDQLRVVIDDIKDDLKKPNSAINLTSPSLENLTDALALEGDIPKVKAKTIYLSESTIKASDNMVALSVTVQGVKVSVPVFPKGHTLTDSDVKRIINAVEGKMEKFDYPAKYYDCNYAKSVFTALVGKDVTTLRNKKFEFHYTPKKFTVEIEGAESVTVDIDNLQVSLPSSDSPVYRYEYDVFGKKIYSNKYTFTVEEFDKIISAGGYKITRTKLNIQTEEYKDLINKLNNSIDSDLVVFALTEKDGEYSVVMKISITNPQMLMSALMGMTKELTKHGYVAFGDNAMISSTESGMQVSIQALIDTILESGFSSQSFVKMINADGTVNSMAMPGELVSDKEMGQAGALLTETELCLGNSADDIKYHLPIYITVGALPSSLISFRNIYADFLCNYFSFEFVDGKIALDVTIPKKAYLACAPVLFSTKGVNLLNSKTLNEQTSFTFLQNLISPMMSGDLSIKKIEKTIAKLGYKADLSKYESALETLQNLYSRFTFVNNDDGTFASLNIDSYIEGMNLGVIADLIVEKGNGISIPISTHVENLDEVFSIMSTFITIALIIVVFGGIVVTLILVEIHRRETFTDSIPLVKYDINDDDIFGGVAEGIEQAPTVEEISTLDEAPSATTEESES